MRQISWEILPEWTIGGTEIVRVEGRDFFIGAASGQDNNCLIDTLRQLLNEMGAMRASSHASDAIYEIQIYLYSHNHPYSRHQLLLF